jgi:hypothetical protein
VTLPSAQAPGCNVAPASACPPTFAAVPRQTHCSAYGLVCEYPLGRCACAVPAAAGAPLDASAEAEWLCQDPAAGCPQPRPLLGSACPASQEGLACDYGACDIPGSDAETCTGGIWVQASVPCPN